MKIYTKTGDDGTTSLIGGTRVNKFDTRIEAYGTVDELISFTGFLRDMIENEELVKTILRIQDQLMVCASILATDCKDCDQELPSLDVSEIEFLEHEIDQMNLELPELNSFILPGGHIAVSSAHICRSICRRAERNTLKINIRDTNHQIAAKYLNRLSDYFFVLARKLSKDLKAKEIPWIPKV